MNVNIKNFGAKSGSLPQTAKIQAAIDCCYKNGGGKVIIPAGSFCTGGIRIRSGITLYLQSGARLIASKDPNDYMGILRDEIEPVLNKDITNTLWQPVDVRRNFEHMNCAASRWNNALIKGIDAHDISIIGEDDCYIDGRDCFDELGEENYRGPHTINFHRCRNIKLNGYEIRNSANWAHAMFDCKNLKINSVKVIGGHDGIHLTSCKNILIRNSNFYTGDDCIAGIDNLNVFVEKCTLNTACSAFRFGGRNVLVKNCRMFGPAKYLFRGSLTDEEKRNGVSSGKNHRYNMLSAYTYYADFSREIKNAQGNIAFKKCKIENSDRFIHYNFSGNEPWQRNKPLQSIVFKKIDAEGIKEPLVMYGDKSNPLNAKIIDSSIKFKNSTGAFMLLCNCKRVLIKHADIKDVKGPVLIKKWSNTGKIVLKHFTCNANNAVIENLADEPFECPSI